jgi:hypothetical protein
MLQFINDIMELITSGNENQDMEMVDHFSKMIAAQQNISLD